MQVRHTGIVVRDLDAALRFYVGILGFEVTAEAEESGERMDAMLRLAGVKVTTVKLQAPGGGMIELLKFASPEWGRPSIGRELCDMGISHIALTVGDLEAEVSRLVYLGVEFLSPRQVSPGGTASVAFCRDPEGNYIELVQELH